MQITPYLAFDGNCEAALEFYKQVLHGEISELHRYADSPMAAEVGPAYGNKVMHATFNVAGSQIMASDSPPGQAQPMSGFTLALSPDDVAGGETLFKGLAEGGTILMPFAATFWAKGFGMVKDRFGLTWSVNCE